MTFFLQFLSRFGRFDNLRQLRRRFDGLGFSRLLDLTGNLLGKLIFAIFEKNTDQVLVRIVIHNLVSCQASFLIHPHIQRCVLFIRKTALPLIQLRTRYAQVVTNSINLLDPYFIQTSLEIAEIILDKGHHAPLNIGSQTFLGIVNRSLILVKSIQMSLVSQLAQKILAMPSSAQGRINIDAIWLNIKLVNRFMKKYGNVMKFFCHILPIISHSCIKKNLKEYVSF